MKKYIYQINPVVILTTHTPLAKITIPKKVWSDEFPDYLDNRFAILKAVEEIFGVPFVIKIGDYELELTGFTDSDALIGFEVEEDEE